MYKLSNNVTYFASFVEHIAKEIKKFIDGSVINASVVKTNIFRIQAHNSVMCGYFCIWFIDFVLNGESLADFTDLFFPKPLPKNDDLVLNYFKMDLATNMYTNLNDQQKFRLNKRNVDKDYFLAETRERELLSKRLSK